MSNGFYKFQPTEAGKKFIKRLNPPVDNEIALQEFVYNKVYFASSLDIAVSSKSGVLCNKRNCLDKSDCGFIPNYPVINFGNITELSPDLIPSPKNHWIEIERVEQFFKEVLDRI